MDLAMWNFQGVYHCLLENSLGAVASTGQPRSDSAVLTPENNQRRDRDKKFGEWKMATKQIVLDEEEVWYNWK